MFGWLHLAIERRTRAKASRQGRICNHIPAWYMRRLSQMKLVHALRYVYRKSAAQRNCWNNAGLKLGDIRSAEALEYIPLTTGAQLAERPEDYICVPREELIHILTTSSTKGLKKTIYFTAEDFKHQIRTMATHLKRFPGAERVACIFLVHEPTWSVASVVRRSTAEAGMLGFISGVHRSIADHIDLIKKYEIDRLITTPSYLRRLTFEAPKELDIKSLNIRYIHLGTQPWSEEFREEMEEIWGAKLIDGYGNNECACAIASECLYQTGLHVSEPDFWVEIVEPATGKVLPEGDEGELVITTLSRRGMPLVRYRTGDLGRLIPNQQRCPCGLPLRKMARIRGRVDDMLIVGAGHNLYPDEVERAVFSVDGITDYQLVVDKKDHQDVLQLRVEANGGAEDLRNALLKALLAIESIGISHRVARTLSFENIEIVSGGTLSQGRPKSIHIIDKRLTASPTKESSITY